MTTTLSPDLLKLVSPEGFLKSSTPPDRGSSARTLILRSEVISDTPDSCLVRLGHTSVLVGIKPSITQASTGILAVSVLPPFGWSRRDQVALAGQLQAALSTVLDFSSLVISGRSVWHLELAFVVLEDDGSVFDACTAAGISALTNFRSPALDASFAVVSSPSVYPSKSLTLLPQQSPLSLTFRRVCGRLIPDCTKIEESVASGNFVFTSRGISDWQGRLETEELESLIPVAQKILDERHKVLLSAQCSL